MNTILITGGLGFVGGRLAKKLAENFRVVVSSRKQATTTTLAAHGKVTQILHQDLLSKENFPEGINTVIHLAALNEWDCVQFPSEAIRVNIDETRIILENSIYKGVEHFIYLSTAHIYGSPLRGIITEDVLPVPLHPYAITHKAAEDYVLAAGLQKKIHSIIVRLSNSFGAPVVPTVNRWTLLANDLSKQAIETNKMVLLSNGCQYRDFICLTDVAEVVYQILIGGPRTFNKHIYNLGSGSAVRIIDMAESIAAVYEEIFGKRISIELPEAAIPTKEPSLHFSIGRLQQEGLQIKNDIMTEIKELLLFCHKNFHKN